MLLALLLHGDAAGEEHDEDPMPGMGDSTAEHQHLDSAAAPVDSAASKPAHTHAPGTPAHKD